jgi:hypothetical protein
LQVKLKEILKTRMKGERKGFADEALFFLFEKLCRECVQFEDKTLGVEAEVSDRRAVIQVRKPRAGFLDFSLYLAEFFIFHFQAGLVQVKLVKVFRHLLQDEARFFAASGQQLFRFFPDGAVGSRQWLF